MQVVKYAFQQHGDDRGQLVALEEFKDIPFEMAKEGALWTVLPKGVMFKHVKSPELKAKMKVKSRHL